ncbi:pyridoxal-phosphate dependent enzyme [Ferroplasma acidiphilum]|uniref:pyridoxal-phosphate dependent enzyme n=1 Tax=Ferroplasma acidiphilum TaxID=74969 RepID=UPI0023F39F59|nr:pyridoxal-phosphate dependent enzyme [Ferroplasma acidiphilum]
MRTVCFNGHPRLEHELRCRQCNEPFEIVPEGKFYDDIDKNFDYISRWVTLGEVRTPVVKINNDLSFKLDYFSPTYSYKDRGTRNLISYISSRRNELNIEMINEDSSGNAGSSIAAYGISAGFKTNIYVPSNANPAKLKQIESYGAHIIKVDGSRDHVQEEAEHAEGFYASHILNPEFRDGIRTLAYEIFLQGKMPDNIFVPISAGTLLSGLYSGLTHLYNSGEISKVPVIVGVQPENISPVCSFINGEKYDPDNNLSSIADALVAKRPVLMNKMIKIMNDGNRCISVSENEIITARKDLALKGFYAEYSSATVFAAYRKFNFEGSSLLVLTGNGLKN